MVRFCELYFKTFINRNLSAQSSRVAFLMNPYSLFVESKKLASVTYSHA